MEEVLVFSHEPDRSYTTYQLNTGSTRSGSFVELFPNRLECFVNANQTAWNREKVFGFETGGCTGPGSVRLMARDLLSGSVTELPLLENAHTGDTPHGIWVNGDYFFVLFDDLNPDTRQTFQDGLVVFDTHTYKEVYSIISPTIKGIYVDGNQLFISNWQNTVQFVELPDPENTTTKIPNPSFPVNSRVQNSSIYQNKIGVILPEYNFQIPAVYDIGRNEYSYVNREKFLHFFKRDTVDLAAEILRPEAFEFNLENGTFAVTYLIFDPGESDPKSSAIVFMDFGGNILFRYEFPPSTFMPVKIIRYYSS
jgi:hypothetical protein